MSSEHLKICPACRAASSLDAIQCLTCGHQFRTRFTPPAPENQTVAIFAPNAAQGLPVHVNQAPTTPPPGTYPPAIYAPATYAPAAYPGQAAAHPASRELPGGRRPPRWPFWLLVGSLLFAVAGIVFVLWKTSAPPFLGEWVSDRGGDGGRVIIFRPDGSGETVAVVSPDEIGIEGPGPGSTLNVRQPFQWHRDGPNNLVFDPPLPVSTPSGIQEKASVARWAISSDHQALDLSASVDSQDDSMGVYRRRSYFANPPRWLASWEQANPEAR